MERDPIRKTISRGIRAAALAAVLAAALSSCSLSINTNNNAGQGNQSNAQTDPNSSGRTVKDVADSKGVSLDEFLKEFGLPADMPGNTDEAAAYYSVPVKKIAEEYGTDFEGLKAELGFADSVTPDTKWGDAEATVKVGAYVGEENLDKFKSYYGLGDEVTADTLWGEIRDKVDKKDAEDRALNGQ